jgi:hypothetical protein
MTGKVITGKSFAGALAYCLEDKRELSALMKLKLSALEKVQHTNRAEVLAYNLCYGNKAELTTQMNAIRRLSRKVEQPVFHFTLNLPEKEKLTHPQWITASEKLAETFGLQEHQYLVILHKDTPRQHIHIIANRVGYDGIAAPTSHSKRKIADLCRALEKEFQLQEVLSPRRFLPKQLRDLPRHDSRKEKMKADIKSALSKSASFEQFARHMKNNEYKIIKGRGIKFIDEKKVQVKGSELGYSLQTIEKILGAKQTLKLTGEIRQAFEKPATVKPQQVEKKESKGEKQTTPPEKQSAIKEDINPQNDHSLLKMLTEPVGSENNQQLSIPNDPRKKKKRRRPRL